MSSAPVKSSLGLRDTQLLVTGVATITLTALYFLCFLTVFQMPLLPGPVMFFRGVKLMLLLAVAFAAIATFAEIRSQWARRYFASYAGALLAILSAMSLTMCFFVVIPVTLDRSVTTFMLSRMAADYGQEPREYTKEEIESILRDDYISARDAAGRRMREQVISGNITCTKTGCKLTKQGEGFLALSEKVVLVFGMGTEFTKK